MKIDLSGFRNAVHPTLVLLLSGVIAAGAITPNPLISRGKTVKTSNGNGAALVDGVYGSGVFTFSPDSWFAIDAGTGPTTIFISWNTTSYTWSDKISDPQRADCRQTPSYPVNYTIQTSSNSTDGADGEWTTAVTVSDNQVTARGHIVTFTGMRWVKMAIASSNRTSDKMDEVEVFDASNGADDTWFFAGTSISANAFKSFPAVKSFPTWVNETHAGFNPAMIRGGIPCIISTHFARDLSMYLEAAGNCRYWAIEMGTNDAWGGTNENVAAFKSNLQLIIDSCKARGIEPVIANVLATDSAKAGWQVNPDYAKAIADLVTGNTIIEGPDYFAAFKGNPTYFSDGVHPSKTGSTTMHKLWAEKMDVLYNSSAVDPAADRMNRSSRPRLLSVVSGKAQTIISVNEPGVLSVFSLNGQLVHRTTFRTPGTCGIAVLAGCRVLQFTSETGSSTVRMIE